jgi:HD-GYP domain-containing protein (c-di-GMP phosphodiesterase class II)
MAARVLAVADSFDAMTADRPYRGAMSEQAAVAELRANVGSQFDPAAVDALVAVLPVLRLDEGVQVPQADGAVANA